MHACKTMCAKKKRHYPLEHVCISLVPVKEVTGKYYTKTSLSGKTWVNFKVDFAKVHIFPHFRGSFFKYRNVWVFWIFMAFYGFIIK